MVTLYGGPLDGIDVEIDARDRAEVAGGADMILAWLAGPIRVVDAETPGAAEATYRVDPAGRLRYVEETP